MPRKSKVRGTASKKRGISNEQVGVFSAIDAFDRTLVEIAGLGPESLENLLPFKERFEEGSLLITDSKQAFVQFAKEAKISLDQVPAGKRTSKINNNLATINGLHGQLRHFFSCYRGVSTRHLQGYLDFFKYLHHLKYTTEYAMANNKMYNYSISSITKMLIKQIYSKMMPINL